MRRRRRRRSSTRSSCAGSCPMPNRWGAGWISRTERRVVSQIVIETLRVVGAGALAAWVLMFLVALHLLGGVISLPVFAGVPAILLLVAAIASWLPARRATSVDVMVALRQE